MNFLSAPVALCLAAAVAALRVPVPPALEVSRMARR